VTIYAGGRLGTAPTMGPGRHQVQGGGSLMANGKSSVWSFYGSVGGEILDVQVFGRYMHPSGST
jgi:hypothetical protein